MPSARWLGCGYHQQVALLLPTLIGGLLVGSVVSILHDCHDHDDGPCAICLLAKAPICMPEDPPPPPPQPRLLRLTALPAVLPLCRPLFAVAARAPPVDLL